MCFVVAVGSRHFDARFWFCCGAVARPRLVCNADEFFKFKYFHIVGLGWCIWPERLRLR